MRQRQLRKQGGVGRSTESINPTKYLLQGHPSSAFLQVFFWFSKLEKALWEGHSIPQQVCPTQPGIEGTEPGCTRATAGISSRKWEDLRSGENKQEKVECGWSALSLHPGPGRSLPARGRVQLSPDSCLGLQTTTCGLCAPLQSTKVVF